MNWEVVAAIAQLIAAIAVVPSVLYLAIQVGIQNKQSRRSAAYVLMQHFNDLGKSLSENGDLASIHLRGVQSFDALEPVERLRFASYVNRVFLLSEGLYLLYLDGSLAPELWQTFERTTSDLIAFPGVQAWWTTRKAWHTQKFRAIVDQMIADGKKPTIYDRYT